MANFSVNQVRHLYVATSVADNDVTSSSEVGTIKLVTDTDKSHMYFKYMGKGGQVRSDLINIKDIMYAKAVPAGSMAHPLKSVVITLNERVSSIPVVGQDYIIRIAIRQFVSPSDESDYIKYGVAKAVSGMSATDLYTELAASLFKNFSREATKLLKFSVGGEEVANVKIVNGATTLYNSDNEVINATEDGITITEVPQEWVLGVTEQVPVYFDVMPTTIILNGDEVQWGSVEDTTPKKQNDGTWNPALTYANSIGNGKKIADLEYFCMGERGDIYRKVGWPRVVNTEYMVNSEQEYHVFNIHYAYVGPNEGSQKSEKDITIVCSDKAQLNTLVGAFNTATDLEVATLD